MEIYLALFPLLPKNMQQPPKNITIAGCKWSIEINESIAETHNVFGLTRYNSQTIYLDPRCSNDKMKDTLWHEILHAVWWSVGLEERMKDKEHQTTEEEIISSISMTHLAVLRENDSLREYLFTTYEE